MKIPERQNAAENELMEALLATVQNDSRAHQALSNCPGEDELRSFVRGKASTERRAYLVAHLASCDRCIDVLQKRRARRSMVKEVTLIFAAAVVLLVAIWMGSRDLRRIHNRIDTVDLRPFALTRGGATVAAAGQAPAVAAKASRLRLILAAGSEGQYECEILDGSKDAALMKVSGETFLQNHQVILELSMQSNSFHAGQYTIALRKQGHDWVFYPIVIR